MGAVSILLSIIGFAGKKVAAVNWRTLLTVGLIIVGCFTAYLSYRYVKNLQNDLIVATMEIEVERLKRFTAEEDKKILTEDIQKQIIKSEELEADIEIQTAKWNEELKALRDLQAASETTSENQNETPQPYDPSALNARNAATNRLLERRR